MRLLLVASLLLVSCLARAADPACESPVEADPAVVYDARAGIRLCAPTLDAGSPPEPLVADELATCSLYLDGTLRTSFAASPGALYRITPPASWPKRAALSATCEGPGGTSASTPVYDARLRTGRPAPPWLLP